VIALSISPEGLEAMGKPDGLKTDRNAPSNPEEEIYIHGLSEFGEVIKPPPCFSMALERAKAMNIPVKALDMDDEHYTLAYCKHVNTMDMIRQGHSRKSMPKHRFVSKTPEEFVLEWDDLVNRLKGYRELENSREEWLAKGISKLAQKEAGILAIVELERLKGVEKNLRSMGCEPVILQ
jgi:pheromone shutdown protein TraB